MKVNSQEMDLLNKYVKSKNREKQEIKVKSKIEEIHKRYISQNH